MTAKQRVLALKYLEKQKKNPGFAKKIGVEIKIKEKEDKKWKDFLNLRKMIRMLDKKL